MSQWFQDFDSVRSPSGLSWAVLRWPLPLPFTRNTYQVY